MAGRRSVAVAGTHGKTSTTSMLTVALQACGVDPSFAIGGDLNESGSNAHHGSGDVFVAEADESDGSFLLLAPVGAIVTNVEADHLDNYGDLAAVEAAFDRVRRPVAAGGFVVLCADDPGAARLRRRGPRAAARRAHLRARRPTPTCGWSTCGVGAGRHQLHGRARRRRRSAGCSIRCPGSTWRSTAPRRCWPGSSSGCRPPG